MSLLKTIKRWDNIKNLSCVKVSYNNRKEASNIDYIKNIVNKNIKTRNGKFKKEINNEKNKLQKLQKIN